jgi:hypothetical protein
MMEGRYMLVTYYLKPTGKWDEVTSFKNNLKPQHFQTAKVILDLRDKKIVKNGLNPDATYDDMIEFYKRMLGDRLTPYLPQESP